MPSRFRGPAPNWRSWYPVQFLAGPGTFLNEAVIQIDEQLRRLAATVPPDQLREFLLQVAARYGITSAPSISNPEFLASVVFDLHQARGTPKARLAYLFPNDHSTQIVLRLRPDLSGGERSEALRLIREAVYDTTPRKACTYRGRPEACFGLHGRHLHDHRCADLGRRDYGRTQGIAADSLRGFRCRHGSRAAFGLSLAFPVAALGDRPCRGGAYLRPTRSLWRLADDCLDRDPADLDRARGRLRDSATGAV